MTHQCKVCKKDDFDSTMVQGEGIRGRWKHRPEWKNRCDSKERDLGKLPRIALNMRDDT